MAHKLTIAKTQNAWHGVAKPATMSAFGTINNGVVSYENKFQIKAYSRTTSESDDSKMSRFEYNGSFRTDEIECNKAFNENDRSTLVRWAAAMDCFYDAMFICAETDQVVTFNRYED